MATVSGAAASPKSAAVAAAPTVLVVLIAGWLCWRTGTPVVPAAKLAVFTLVAVLLPGVALHRVLRGRPYFRVADLAFGFAVGALWHLVGWAVATPLGISVWWWYGCWGILPAAVVTLVRPLRERALHGDHPRRLPVGVAWLSVLAWAIIAVRQARELAATHALPWVDGQSRANAWNADVYWHLANIGELMNHVNPQTAPVAGEPFHYHWLYAASMAGYAAGTGVDPAIVLTRFWAVPLHLALVGLLVAVGHHLAGRALVGALAALLVAVGPLWMPTGLAMPELLALAPLSPSQDFGLLVLLGATHPALSIIRGRARPGDWLVFAVLVAAAPGAKSSILPLVVAGLAVATMVTACRRQRWWWQPALATVTAALSGVLMPFSSGAAAGVGFQIAAFLQRDPSWQMLNRGEFTWNQVSLGWLPAGTDQPLDVVFLGLALLASFGNIGWALVSWRPVRTGEAGVWFLWGAGLAGLGGALVVNQDGGSQGWFLRGALPLLALAAGWGLLVVWRSARRVASARRCRTAGAAGLLVGAALGLVTVLITVTPPADPQAAWLRPMVLALLTAAALVAALVWWYGWGRRATYGAVVVLVLWAAVFGQALAPRLPAWEWLLRGGLWIPDPSAPLASTLGSCAAALTGLALAVGIVTVRRAIRTVAVLALTVGVVVAWTWRMPADDGTAISAAVVSADETSAARWLGAHAGPDDVVATNVHCTPIRTVPRCNARSYWVTGLSGRRMLMEGWAYSAAAHEANGRDGLRYDNQPFADQRLYALNEKAFRDPDAGTLQALRDHGVRWLFADSAAGPVSPRLAQLAELVHRDGAVTVYRL